MHWRPSDEDYQRGHAAAHDALKNNPQWQVGQANKRACLAVLEQAQGPLRTHVIANLVGLSESTVHSHLLSLQVEGSHKVGPKVVPTYAGWWIER